MPSINGKMDSEEEDMDQDTPVSDKSDSRSSHSGSGSDEEESSGMKRLDLHCRCHRSLVLSNVYPCFCRQNP